MIFDLLEKNGIVCERFDHPPVFTCEEMKKLLPDLPGTGLKNLFLRDGKGRKHFLLAVHEDKKVNLKLLGEVLQVSGLGFASAERLKKCLDLEPGAVSLLAAINDRERNVQILIDGEVWKEDKFQCHPLVNTCTIVISRQGLEKFFALSGHEVLVVDVPGS